MIKKGFKQYWIFLPLALVILYYLVKHMKPSAKIQTGPVVSLTPSLDPGLPILANISSTLSIIQAKSQVGQQTSASINPIPGSK